MRNCRHNFSVKMDQEDTCPAPDGQLVDDRYKQSRPKREYDYARVVADSIASIFSVSCCIKFLTGCRVKMAATNVEQVRSYVFTQVKNLLDPNFNRLSQEVEFLEYVENDSSTLLDPDSFSSNMLMLDLDQQQTVSDPNDQENSQLTHDSPSLLEALTHDSPSLLEALTHDSPSLLEAWDTVDAPIAVNEAYDDEDRSQETIESFPNSLSLLPLDNDNSSVVLLSFPNSFVTPF